MNVWIVSQGNYEDYRVESVWSSKEKAERYCQQMNEIKKRYSDDYYVDPYQSFELDMAESEGGE
jgi:hypothetical protein